MRRVPVPEAGDARILHVLLMIHLGIFEKQALNPSVWQAAGLVCTEGELSLCRMHASAYHTIPDTPHSLVERMRSRAYICQFTKNGSLLVGIPPRISYPSLCCQCSLSMFILGNVACPLTETTLRHHARLQYGLLQWR